MRTSLTVFKFCVRIELSIFYKKKRREKTVEYYFDNNKTIIKIIT